MGPGSAGNGLVESLWTLKGGASLATSEVAEGRVSEALEGDEAGLVEGCDRRLRRAIWLCCEDYGFRLVVQYGEHGIILDERFDTDKWATRSWALWWPW